MVISTRSLFSTRPVNLRRQPRRHLIRGFM
jgi:hypothetical protein